LSALARVILLGAPGGTSASAISSSRIDLSWTAVVGAVSYRVYRGGVLVDSPTGTTSSSTGLTASTLYSFQVASVDVRGLEGPKGSAFTASTLAAPDTTAPTAPVIAVANVSSTSQQVTLTTASSDAGTGLASYALERATNLAFTANLVTEASGLSIFPRSVTGLSAATTYYYRARATDAAGNVGSYSATVSATTTSSPTGAIFNPNMNSATSVAGVFTNDVNTYGEGPVSDWGTAALVNMTNPRTGTTKAVRLRYPANEAGVELKPQPFSPTTTLFCRKYIYFSGGWTGNWPFGLKTSRYFTRADYATDTEPNAWAYCSEKLVDGQYDLSTDDAPYGMGYNNSIYNQDLYGPYTAGMVFNNGLPYIRELYWYKLETWLVLSSGLNVSDGLMQIWIDDVLVADRTNLAYRSTARGVPNGTGFQSMWFGGNYSGSSWGHPGIPLDRFETDFYLSPTLDR
jgi:hypothetical protein